VRAPGSEMNATRTPGSGSSTVAMRRSELSLPLARSRPTAADGRPVAFAIASAATHVRKASDWSSDWGARTFTAGGCRGRVRNTSMPAKDPSVARPACHTRSSVVDFESASRPAGSRSLGGHPVRCAIRMLRFPSRATSTAAVKASDHPEGSSSLHVGGGDE
jgi:hypothetical protein